MQPELIGYTDRFSVASGQTIRFMVSSDAPEYDVQIVRLIHADNNPKGPGFKEEAVESPANRRYTGRKQTAHAGSYVIVENNPVLAELKSFTLQAWIYPTTPANGELQGIISKWATWGGFGMYLSKKGRLGLWLGGFDPEISEPLRSHEWYFVTASYDHTTATARLDQVPLKYPHEASSCTNFREDGRHVPHLNRPDISDAPLLIGAAFDDNPDAERIIGKGIFNGKIESPRIFASAQPDRDKLVAEWDLAADISSAKVTDIGPHGFHGITINSPARGVTGHNWDGSEVDFKRAPEQYGAIHFHEDDLDDARWDVDFELTIPDGWKSGIYAARLRAGDEEDHIPFFVRPHKGKPTAKALYLIPTMTYLAYANYHKKDVGFDDNGVQRQPAWQPIDQYLKEHPELAMSIYDYHSDGSGCHYSTRLRPITNMRAKFAWGLVGGPRHFAADLYLIDWMETKGFDYDVVTDEDLHFDGLELLRDYKVVITGTHPEYWTTPMLDALQSYLSDKGRMMYLGGNGFYWVTSVDPEKPHVVEVRRGIAGTRAWESPPGEMYHSTTGEFGGLWRYRGRAPNKIAGIGFTAQGWNGTAPGYTRQPGSFDPRASFVFEGIGADETIGNFGLGLGGVAGDELDRVDRRLGTPHHTLVLASSSGHPDGVLPVIEDYNDFDLKLFRRENWQVRSDIVYFETGDGGAVFSVGSIAWCDGLSHNDYNNNVSRMTENVLRKFLE